MLTREEDIDAHALFKQGWTISAIARHLGRDRKTIRAHLRGDRTPASEPARKMTGSTTTSAMSASGSRMIRICGPRRCSTNSSTAALTAPIRR